MQDATCPVCKGTKLVVGDMGCGDGISTLFRPRSAMRGFGVPFDASMRTCLDCGHLWSSIKPALLRKALEESPHELAKQEIRRLDFGPYYDLPDTDWGREIGDHIAELDELARDHRTALLRRYREMRGVTWDEAAKEATHWRDFSREHKLALFGWELKKKPIKDDLAELL